MDSIGGPTSNPRWGVGEGITSSLDITRAAKLTILIFLGDVRSTCRSQHIFLGTTTISPFDGTTTSGLQWLSLQHGKGRIRTKIDYLPSAEHKTFDLESSNFQVLNSAGTVLRVWERCHGETIRPTWTRKTLRPAKHYSLNKEAHNLRHQFIAPLSFAYQLLDELQLYTPCISGGHLFHHLQRVGHFEENTARIYAAEIISGLEYLHDILDTAFRLKSGDILLDLQGHITLCNFGFFLQPNEGGEITSREQLEYPPPESLIEEENSTQTVFRDEVEYKIRNFWTLGILLSEMLTGMPPFYSDNPQTIYRKILDHHFTLPESLSPSARELLAQLFEPKPKQRLGARGVADIKAHAFFGGIDWHKVLRRGYTPTLVPNDDVGFYKHYGVPYPYEPPLSYHEAMRRQFAGWRYTGREPTIESPESKASTYTVSRNDDWQLVWDTIALEFRFHNRLTKEESPVLIRQEDHRPSDEDEKLSHANTSISPTIHQILGALEAAMINGYDDAVLQVLDYAIDLNIAFHHEGLYRTPLQWAVTWDKSHLVQALLARSETSPDHVTATQALLLAVEKQNIEIVDILLAADVQCNFRNAEIPSDKRPHFESEGPVFDRSLCFTPPLVQAVQHGNVEIARRLIARGADVDAEYHALESHHDQHIYFVCGRAIQLAIELGPPEMAHLLVQKGASLETAIVHRYRKCSFVERAVYQRVMAGLQTISRVRVE
jgi:serum/glucocorticoid-regulated kinase 2